MWLECSQERVISIMRIEAQTERLTSTGDNKHVLNLQFTRRLDKGNHGNGASEV